MGIQDYAKLPGLLTQLMDKIPAEVEVRVEAKFKDMLKDHASDIEAAVEKRVEARFGDEMNELKLHVEDRIAALEGGHDASDLDSKVEAALRALFPDGAFDEVERALAAFGGEKKPTPEPEQKAPPATEPPKPDAAPAPAEDKKPKTEVPSGFADFSHQADAQTEADPRPLPPINGVQSRAFD